MLNSREPRDEYRFHCILSNSQLRKPLVYDSDGNIDYQLYDEDMLVDDDDDDARLDRIHRYVENLDYVVLNPTNYQSGGIIENLVFDMYECMKWLLEVVTELFEDHVGRINEPINLVEAKANDPAIGHIGEQLNSLYRSWQPLYCIFNRLCYAFKFNDPLMKQLNKHFRTTDWFIIILGRVIDSETDDLDFGRNVLYIETKYYNPGMSTNWNVGLGYFKPNQILSRDEYQALVCGYSSEDYSSDDDD